MQTTLSEPILGVDHTKVRLAEHCALWADLYDDEARRIRAALGDRLIDLQHVGSTSVPGIKAKPILDMLAGVAKLDDALALTGTLASIGYEFMPQAGVPNDHIFGKGDPRTHLLHVVEYDGPAWREDIAFRDALLADPTLVAEYEALKVELAAKYADQRAKYTASKNDFIRAVLDRCGISSAK